MERLRLGRAVIGALVAVGMLAGCGGAGTTTASVPSAMTQNVARHARSKALIYATGGCGGTCVLSYSDGQIVASISQKGTGPCSDAAGNVFIPSDNQIFEFQHGGTTPIATLTLPDSYDIADICSVDPTTNNLAVIYQSRTCGCAAVFANESGTPKAYSTKIDALYGGYDNAGNLFVDGVPLSNKVALSELARGSSKFTPLTVSGKFSGGPGRLQWDGTYLTYEGLGKTLAEGAGKHAGIMELAISGSVATVVKTIRLNGAPNRTTLSWIYDGNVLVPYSTSEFRFNKIGVWSYPTGGSPKTVLKFPNSKSWSFQGVTISAATTRK